MNQRRHTAGTSAADNKSTTGQTSVARPEPANVVLISLLSISVAAVGLLSRLRLNVLARHLQQAVRELHFRPCLAVQYIARCTVLLIFFQFLIRECDFITHIGLYSPIVRIIRAGIAIHGFAVWPIVSGDRQLHRADAAFQREETSHDTLAECPLTHHDGSLVILQASSDNFSSRCRIPIHQKRYRETAEGAFRSSVINRFATATPNRDNSSLF